MFNIISKGAIAKEKSGFLSFLRVIKHDNAATGTTFEIGLGQEEHARF